MPSVLLLGGYLDKFIVNKNLTVREIIVYNTERKSFCKLSLEYVKGADFPFNITKGCGEKVTCTASYFNNNIEGYMCENCNKIMMS